LCGEEEAFAVTPGVFGRMSEGGQLAIWGMRHGMVAMLQGRAVPLSVSRSFDSVGGPRICAALAALLLVAARDADRPLAIFPPCCQELSTDEENLARVLTALTRNSSAAALAHLRAPIGGEPSAALLRHARIVAERFKTVGLMVGLVECADPHAPVAI
jgi:hypothetical protein